MSDIPEDIHVASNALIEAEFGAGYFNPRLWEGIASAILAERLRCAQIADELDQPGIPGTSEWLAMGNFAGAIRDAILDPNSLPKTPSQAAKPHGVPPPTPCGTPNPAGEP